MRDPLFDWADPLWDWADLQAAGALAALLPGSGGLCAALRMHPRSRGEEARRRIAEGLRRAWLDGRLEGRGR